jgi:hypothetical protein
LGSKKEEASFLSLTLPKTTTIAKKIIGKNAKFFGLLAILITLIKLLSVGRIFGRKINCSFHTITILQQLQKECQAPTPTVFSLRPLVWGQAPETNSKIS